MKNYLLTPGPTPVPESVLAALAQPIVHHRTATFQSLFQAVQKQLKWLFQTEQDVLILSSSGTGAMEASVTALFNPGDHVLVLQAGKFGERWAKIARAHALVPTVLTCEAGQSFTAAEVEEKLKELGRVHPIKAVLFQASETSTGVRLPVREICAAARAHGALGVVDAITALGVVDLPMDAWGIDVLITGSQKALMLPPGLACIALSARAWLATESSQMPRFYFDLREERKALSKNQTAWTPAISLIQGLHESLRLLQAESLAEIFGRHNLLARATRAGVQAMGLELLAKDSPSDSVTAVRVPQALLAMGKKIPELLHKKYGITIVGGQDELEGKILRLSHMGYCDRFDIVTALAGLEMTLLELGHPLKLGVGVGAALEIFQKASARK